MIDFTTETLLTLPQAAEQLPTKPTRATVWLWVSKGIRGVRLEAVRIGRQWVTSTEALQRFAERLTEPERGEMVEIKGPRRVEEREGLASEVVAWARENGVRV